VKSSTVSFLMGNEKNDMLAGLAMQMGNALQRFSLAVEPDEIGPILERVLPDEGIRIFVSWVNQRMPRSKITGRFAHTFTFGRKHGIWIMAVTAYKGHYSEPTSLVDLGISICQKAEARGCQRAYVALDDDQSIEVHIDWKP